VLSENQKKKIIKALEARRATEPCPRCGASNFTLADGYTTHPLQTELGSLTIGGPSIPAALAICTNCGFLSQHALGVLGLLPKQPEAEA
jgi:ribosomal protein S27AE